MVRIRLVLVALLLAFFVHPVAAADTSTTAAQNGLRWLLARQQADGSFPGFGPGATVDAVLAMVAAGVDPAKTRTSGKSALDFLSANTSKFSAESVAATGKLTLAVAATGNDPASFGKANLVKLIEQAQNKTTGVYGVTPTDHAFALLALSAAGQSIPTTALAGAAKAQRADGGWSFDGAEKSTSDTNTTALMIQGLVAAGSRDATLSKAVAYLKTQQNKDGGFTYSMESTFGTDSDANSTALAIQALIAAGEKPASLKQGSNDPVSALVKLQNSTGAFRYQAAMPDDNDLATAQAIPALLGKAFPLKSTASAIPVAPATLPTTAGEGMSVWLLAASLLSLILGLALRRVGATVRG